MQKAALDRYEEIVTDALKSTAKVRKNLKTAVIMTLILYIVIQRKINVKQKGRYQQSCEQRFGQTFERGLTGSGSMALLNNRIQNIPGVTGTETLISLDHSIHRNIPINRDN